MANAAITRRSGPGRAKCRRASQRRAFRGRRGSPGRPRPSQRRARGLPVSMASIPKRSARLRCKRSATVVGVPVSRPLCVPVVRRARRGRHRVREVPLAEVRLRGQPGETATPAGDAARRSAASTQGCRAACGCRRSSADSAKRGSGLRCVASALLPDLERGGEVPLERSSACLEQRLVGPLGHDQPMRSPRQAGLKRRGVVAMRHLRRAVDPHLRSSCHASAWIFGQSGGNLTVNALVRILRPCHCGGPGALASVPEAAGRAKPCLHAEPCARRLARRVGCKIHVLTHQRNYPPASAPLPSLRGEASASEAGCRAVIETHTCHPRRPRSRTRSVTRSPSVAGSPCTRRRSAA